MSTRKYGWKRSLGPSWLPLYDMPDHHREAANLPASVDLTPECPSVYDQLSLGSCTANALAGLFHFLMIKVGIPAWIPSRLFIYYGERAIEGTTSSDAGAYGSDGVTVLTTQGVCPESLWPYDINEFAVKPSAADYAEALTNKMTGAVTIADGDLAGIKSSIASGYPVAFGFTCYEGLESAAAAATGVVPDPSGSSIGGHEVLLVGYDDASQRFKFRNSWGSSWGVNGYGTISYTYVGNTSLASDFRSATGVTGVVPTPTPAPPTPSPTPTPTASNLITIDPVNHVVAVPSPSSWIFIANG